MERLLSWPLRLVFWSYLLGLLFPANALYFYLDSTTPKCFYEELPKDTLVVGESNSSGGPLSLQIYVRGGRDQKLTPQSGKYNAEEYNPSFNNYVANPDLRIFISVDEVFRADHRVISQQGSSSGRFTFSAADSGDHRICFKPSHATSAQWIVAGQTLGSVKLTLDLVIGETSAIESTDKKNIQSIVQKVKDLNSRLQDIRREQVFQRVRRVTTALVVMTADMLNPCRKGRPSSEINQNRRILEWSGGLSFSWWFWDSLAHGNFLTSVHSSLSKSLLSGRGWNMGCIGGRSTCIV